MYRIENKNAAVSAVQRYLVTVSQIEESLPHITVDGFFGEETRIAVTEFQRLNGLPPTGEVDIVTYDALYLCHTDILRARENKNGVYTKTDFPLQRGDCNDSVLMLNAALRILSEYYEIPAPDDDSFFSEATSTAVLYLRGVFDLGESEDVDYEFMRALSNEIFARQKLKNIK